MATFQKKTKVDLEFFYYLLSSFRVKEIFDLMAAGSGVNNLKIDSVEKLSVEIPTLPEQRAIARILSDIDALIENLDKLIEKKKNIKKGAMQELLTGKKRLPGFEKKKGYKKTEIGVIPEDWEVKRLGDLGKIKDGDWILKESYTSKGVRLLQVGDIGIGKFLDKSVRFISLETAEKLRCTFVEPEKDVLISRMPDPIGRACVAPKLDCPYIVAVDISIFKPYNGISPKFVIYKLNSQEILSLVNKFVAGGTRERISRSNLEDITLLIPPTLPEQRAIAQILSDMDAEIEALERKKEKYEMLKKGAMELLLTGKVRVIEKNEMIEVLQ